MKKGLIILFTTFCLQAKSQLIDTVSANLTLRAFDWAWSVGKYGAGEDSASKAKIRAIRTAIIAANPPNQTTNVTVNNVSGRVLLAIYRQFVSADGGEIARFPGNATEKWTIYTNIRAINNSALQFFLTEFDNSYESKATYYFKEGKGIILDN